MPGIRLAAVCDTNRALAEALAKELGCEALTDIRRLPGRVEAASLAIPTPAHGAVGRRLLAAGIHLLIEKPITTSLAEADALIRTARQKRLVLQVGHVERFNAAIHAAMDRLRHPRFIEVHRLSPYPFRSLDVSVVLDVMIHDLDLVLALVRSPLTRVEAVGMPVLSASEDIANARLTFASGCVANLTASRISDETVRRIRVFQQDSYLSIDYRAQTVELARRHGAAITRVHLPVNRRPPLQDELAAFVHAVERRTPALVPGEAGRDALALALRIERAMRRAPSSTKQPQRSSGLRARGSGQLPRAHSPQP
jgi:predicted dehydrogenase